MEDRWQQLCDTCVLKKVFIAYFCPMNSCISQLQPQLIYAAMMISVKKFIVDF